LLAVAACGEPGSSVATLAQVVAGTYSGTDSAGGLLWTIQQSGQAVSGSGSFLANGSNAPVQYQLRGTFTGGVLELRLLGAPGDSPADSVWFSGRSVPELYAGAGFSGSLNGSSAALFGPLTMYLTSSY
jgi:hypothetical protein